MGTFTGKLGLRPDSLGLKPRRENLAVLIDSKITTADLNGRHAVLPPPHRRGPAGTDPMGRGRVCAPTGPVHSGHMGGPRRDVADVARRGPFGRPSRTRRASACVSAPPPPGRPLSRALGARHPGQAGAAVSSVRALLHSRAGGSDLLHRPVCPAVAREAVEATRAAATTPPTSSTGGAPMAVKRTRMGFSSGGMTPMGASGSAP